MSHLGRWLSAQVDGELDGAERDRVLNHLAGCDACRQEASALRALKRRMTALGESVADGAIAGRLIERARSEPNLVAAQRGKSPWSDFPVGAGLWPRPCSLRASWPRPVWPGWRIATGSAGTALVAIGVLAFLLGGGQAQRPVPKVTPSVDAYWMRHIYDTGQLPTTGSLSERSPAVHSPTMISPPVAKMRLRSSSP